MDTLEIFEKFSYTLIYKNKKYIIRKNCRYKFKNIISKIIIVMKFMSKIKNVLKLILIRHKNININITVIQSTYNNNEYNIDIIRK